MRFLVDLLVQLAKYRPMKLRSHQAVQDGAKVQNGLIQHLRDLELVIPRHDYPYS